MERIKISNRKLTEIMTRQKVSMWAAVAVEQFQSGNLIDAELSAYEAGRYGLEMPSCFAGSDFFTSAYERGDRDAQQDAIYQAAFYEDEE